MGTKPTERRRSQFAKGWAGLLVNQPRRNILRRPPEALTLVEASLLIDELKAAR